MTDAFVVSAKYDEIDYHVTKRLIDTTRIIQTYEEAARVYQDLCLASAYRILSDMAFHPLHEMPYIYVSGRQDHWYLHHPSINVITDSNPNEDATLMIPIEVSEAECFALFCKEKQSDSIAICKLQLSDTLENVAQHHIATITLRFVQNCFNEIGSTTSVNLTQSGKDEPQWL